MPNHVVDEEVFFTAEPEDHNDDLYEEEDDSEYDISPHESDFYSENPDGIPRDPEDYDDSMDGDHESGLASAGFGTDEDYGLYDDGCDDSGDW